MKKQESIEQRLERMSNAYYKINLFIDTLPETVPTKIKTIIKEKVQGDKELEELMKGLEKYRAPRFLVVGRTGVGKSSLINAICGSYLAETSAVVIGTKSIEKFEYKRQGRTVLEVLDTRGIGESLSNTESLETDAESALLDEFESFLPDAILLVLPCAARDRINEDIATIIKIQAKYKKLNSIEIPVIVVLNRADELEPAQIKNHNDYPNRKLQNIERSIERVKSIFIEQKVKYNDIIAISSYIDWGVSEEELKEMTQFEKENLTIEFDGRYHMDELIEMLEKNLDIEAKTGLLIASRLEEVVKRVTKKIVKIFAVLSATVAITPIPIADIYVLTSLQLVMVVFVAALSGREINMASAKEFIMSLGSVSLAGIAFRTFAQQSAKLINVIMPGIGSAVSSGVAYSGTEIIGRSAIAYYVDGKKLNDIKKKLKKSDKEVSKMTT